MTLNNDAKIAAVALEEENSECQTVVKNAHSLPANKEVCMVRLMCMVGSFVSSPNNAEEEKEAQKDNSCAQPNPGFWGPKCGEPKGESFLNSFEILGEKKEKTQQKKNEGTTAGKSFIWRDEEGNFDVVQCDLLSDSDISTADGEDDSDYSDDESASDLSDEEEDEDEGQSEAGGDSLFLPQEIFMLHVLPCVPVLGRTLSATTRALLDGDHDDPTSEEKKEKLLLPTGKAPRFPLQITLRRTFSEALGGRSAEYEVQLRGLQHAAEFEMRTRCDDDDEDEKCADGWKRKTAKLFPWAVRSVFSELRKLNKDNSAASQADQKKPEVELSRPQFEVTVTDALGRMALANEYRYTFLRTPVDGLLEALLSGCPEMDGVE